MVDEHTVGSASAYRYVDSAGLRIAYRDLGDRSAPAVVLLHGLFSSGRTWDGLATRLVAGGRRVVVVDARGHGASEKATTYRFVDFRDDLARLLDTLELDRVDLLGHSLGGHAATTFAAGAPDRVRRLVVEDAPPPPLRGTGYRGPGLAVLPMHQRVALLAAVAVRPQWLRRLDLAMARAVLREFRRPDPGWWARLPLITASTLLVYGGASSHVPGHRLEEMNRLIPDCRLVTIEVGHRVHLTAPDAFAELVLPFLGVAERANG